MPVILARGYFHVRHPRRASISMFVIIARSAGICFSSFDAPLRVGTD